ncbi:MAG: shikimate kinase [Nitrospinae bacterium]|nr:shikimate kinase [Nitrospinota bacterium]
MISFLIGLKGCGKSTLGKEVAKLLHKEYVDTDKLIEEIYFKEKHSRYSFREIYELEGAEKFMELEAEAYHQSIKLDKAIISCGGSLPLNKKIKFEAGKKNRKIIYIYVEKETLRERLRENGAPAFFDPNDFDGSFEKMWEERDAAYKQVCDYIFDNSVDGVEQAKGRFYNRTVSEIMNKEIAFENVGD